MGLGQSSDFGTALNCHRKLKMALEEKVLGQKDLWSKSTTNGLIHKKMEKSSIKISLII